MLQYFEGCALLVWPFCHILCECPEAFLFFMFKQNKCVFVNNKITKVHSNIKTYPQSLTSFLR